VLSHSDRIPDIEKLLVKERVNCITFETLVRRHDVKKIDLLHVDTEGYDFAIIKQVDFDRFRPAIVIYEHKHLQQQQQAECQSYVKNRGYTLVQEGDNTIAFLPGFVERD